MNIKHIALIPYPIAVHLYKYHSETEDSTRKFDYLLDTCFVSLKFLSLTLLADYLHSDITSPSLNERIYSLRKPSLGHWNDFLQAGVALFQKENLDPFVPEIVSFYNTVELNRKIKSEETPDHSEMTGLGLISAFIHLRNIIRGHNVSISKKAAASILANYETLFLEIINELLFMRKYPLLKLNDGYEDIDGDATGLVEMRGWNKENFLTTKGQLPSGNFSEVFLGKTGSAQLLPLFPLTVHEILKSQIIQLYGFEDLLIYDGFNKRGMLYTASTNIGSKIEREQYLETYIKKLEKKGKPKEQIEDEKIWEWFAIKSSAITKRNIDYLQQTGKYVSSAYIPRSEFDSHIRHFLSGSHTVFLLQGPAGIGKTCALCSSSRLSPCKLYFTIYGT